MVIAAPVELKHVEQVADGWHVVRDIVVEIAVIHLQWIGQVVATARRQLLVELPVSLDELNERGVLVIGMADMAAGRERRHCDHRDTRTGAEEVDPLDEAAVVEAAALVDGDEDRGVLPDLGVGLHEMMMLPAKASNRSHFEEAGWPSSTPSGLT